VPSDVFLQETIEIYFCTIKKSTTLDDNLPSRRFGCRPRYFLSPTIELESARIDLQAQHMFSDQFVVGEAGLGVLADHVNVLEVALDRVAFEDRGVILA